MEQLFASQTIASQGRCAGRLPPLCTIMLLSFFTQPIRVEIFKICQAEWQNGALCMASIKLVNVDKIYDGSAKEKVKAVDSINLEIQDKEFIILVGPSGCGKSTTLRMIAGLEEISGGELYIGDKLVNDVEPKDRDIAMVFQNYALYPHMTVYKNMAFGLGLRKMPKTEIDQKVREVAKVLDIEHLLVRKPKALSGGQRQRVALGRAMVRNPQVFLLDEPLSNLDAKLRTSMRSEITKLHKRLQTTFVYVTHDQTEAMTMADRIVVMKDGVIQQVDTPQNLYDNPCNLFVAGFIGLPQMNFFKGNLINDNGYKVKVGDYLVEIKADKLSSDIANNYLNKEIVLGVRPEALKTTSTNSSFIEGVVDVAELMGAEKYLYCLMGEYKFIASVEGRHASKADDVIRFEIDLDLLHLFDADTQKRITNDIL